MKRAPATRSPGRRCVSIVSAETAGDDRETLWLERKSSVRPDSLAKACSAFANTYGGLLVVGVGDEDDSFDGIAPITAEAQLWVKDTLRHHVLPLPAFRARWLPTSDGRGVLLVLVEESSATPHLLTRNGAIYVRNPGSSDPVPISDQRRLLDLTARGDAARAAAEETADRMFSAWLEEHHAPRSETLALAATGIAATFSAALFDPGTPEMISRSVWGDLANDREWRRPHWQQHHVGVQQFLQADRAYRQGNIVGGAVVDDAGAIGIYVGRDQENVDEERGAEALIESELRQWFAKAVDAGRAILSDLGAHGDIRLAYKLVPWARSLYFDEHPHREWVHDVQNTIEIVRWTDFEEDVSEGVFAELARSQGVGPVQHLVEA